MWTNFHNFLAVPLEAIMEMRAVSGADQLSLRDDRPLSQRSQTPDEHVFFRYGPGLRFISFQHGGQDTKFWEGWYGVRVTGSLVTLED
ncbi:hypothetical protein CRUP_023143 [Coryphaenoides rupestris]|nr:hypothetical protein CRUP_023143 [Coryphaenoides rupestris]